MANPQNTNISRQQFKTICSKHLQDVAKTGPLSTSNEDPVSVFTFYANTMTMREIKAELTNICDIVKSNTTVTDPKYKRKMAEAFSAAIENSSTLLYKLIDGCVLDTSIALNDVATPHHNLNKSCLVDILFQKLLLNTNSKPICLCVITSYGMIQTPEKDWKKHLQIRMLTNQPFCVKVDDKFIFTNSTERSKEILDPVKYYVEVNDEISEDIKIYNQLYEVEELPGVRVGINAKNPGPFTENMVDLILQFIEDKLTPEEANALASNKLGFLNEWNIRIYQTKFYEKTYKKGEKRQQAEEALVFNRIY